MGRTIEELVKNYAGGQDSTLHFLREILLVGKKRGLVGILERLVGKLNHLVGIGNFLQKNTTISHR